MDASFKKLAYWMCFIIALNFFGAICLGGYVEGQRATPNVPKMFYRHKRNPHFPSIIPNSSTLEEDQSNTNSTNQSTFSYRIVVVLPTMGRLSYLEKSIKSYLQVLTSDDLIVVFAVKNEASISKMLLDKFPSQFNSSIVVEHGNPIREHLLRDPCGLSAYHNDTLGRVLWRSSIVLEHAWMLYRASFLQPQYVLVMEEDVVIRSSAPFLGQVQTRLLGSPAQSDWNMLHLRDYRRVSEAPSHLGGAFGLLINASCPAGIISLSAFLLRYFDDSPVDWLIGLYFSRMGSAYGVSASDLVVHIGEASTKNFADDVNDRKHCTNRKIDRCPTVMAQKKRQCDQAMVWQVPTTVATSLWVEKLAEAGIK